MNLGIVTRVQIGFSLALVGLMTIGGGTLILHSRLLGKYLPFICSGIGLIGFVMWLAGHAGSGRKAAAEHPLAFLGTATHWGLLLGLSACLVYAVLTYRRLHSSVSAGPPTPRKIVRAEPPVVAFPTLKLQSIIFQGSRSTAIINGKILCIGEDVSQVQVVEIQRDYVKVALQGQTNLLSLGRQH